MAVLLRLNYSLRLFFKPAHLALSVCLPDLNGSDDRLGYSSDFNRPSEVHFTAVTCDATRQGTNHWTHSWPPTLDVLSLFALPLQEPGVDQVCCVMLP